MSNHQKILDLEATHRVERAARLARARRLLRWLPRRSNLHRYPLVSRFAAAARTRPYLWSLRGPSVRRALYVGALIAFLPVYGLHVLIAFWAAICFRSHLGLTLALQLVTNPLTAAPCYYATYRVGLWLISTFGFGAGHPSLGTRFNALVLGGLVVGLALGLVLDLLVRLVIWEAGVLRARHLRTRMAAEAIRAENLAPLGAAVGGRQPELRPVS